MRLAGRRPSGIGLEAGGYVDGYLVESFVPRRGAAELLCEAVDPDGDAVNLVMAWSRPPDKHAWPLFRRLARIRATLQHQALLPVRSVGDYRGRPYLAMDRYPQTSFEELLQSAPRPASQVLVLLAPVCEALDLAHANGLVHQSLSATSLLMDGQTVVIDGFGVAGGPRELTFGSLGVLEARYCPPEELRGEPLGPASNVYSLTALLVHALTGHPPYEGSPAGQAFGHLTEAPLRPSEQMPQLGTAFDDVVARGLAKEAAERPASAGELLADAAAALGVELPARVTAGEDHESEILRPAPIRARRIPKPAVAAAVIAAVLAGLAAGAVLDPFDGGRASAAGPSVDAWALKRLDGQRTALRTRFSSSETPQEQAATAAELAGTYGRAADAVESPRLASAARAAERAYDELGAAAEAGSA
ncbi:MAG TPA: serine/threonine-protein kinase, partial [Thermoleophilaceae bacterium]|nr:serine/threonine-protein kinase [Thermoleophilaceae bacterium]